MHANNSTPDTGDQMTRPAQIVFIPNRNGDVVSVKTLNREAFDNAGSHFPKNNLPIATIREETQRYCDKVAGKPHTPSFTVKTKGASRGGNRYSSFPTFDAAQDYVMEWAARRYRIAI